MSSKLKENTADLSTQHLRSKQDRDNDDGDVLADSEMTQPTDGSVSEDDNGGWFGSITADFRNMAVCFKDSTLPVLGGMASLVHKTAMTMAAEIAQLERAGGLETRPWHSADDEDGESLYLPWEIKQENHEVDVSVYVTDEDLMNKILALSLKQTTFSRPFTSSSNRSPQKENNFFLDESRVTLIRRLLDIDENLAAAHARLSGRGSIQEDAFWRNYFHHCEQTRINHMKQRRSLKEQQQRVRSFGVTSMASSGTLTNCSDKERHAPDDDESLVPVSGTDDSSYVFYPAPSSADSFATTQSFDDMVLVGHGAELLFGGK